jgi:hypothetical protein
MSLALFFVASLSVTTTTKADHDNNNFDDDNLDGDFDIAEYIAEFTCKIFEVFDNMGRNENNPIEDGLNWDTLCDDFAPMDAFLCPYGEYVDAICLASKPLNNPAVKNNWCIPIFGVIKDVGRRNDCIKFCTNYVSDARGGCCDIDNACDI